MIRPPPARLPDAAASSCATTRDTSLNISKPEQRVLHALAQGGCIRLVRDDRGHIEQIDCVTREGYRLADCGRDLFARLKRRRLIVSRGGQPYRISREGLTAVRAQLNNR